MPPSCNKRSAPGDFEQSSAGMKKPRNDVYPHPHEGAEHSSHQASPIASSVNAGASTDSSQRRDPDCDMLETSTGASPQNGMQLFRPDVHSMLGTDTYMGHLPTDHSSFPADFQYVHGQLDPSTFSDGYDLYPQGRDVGIGHDQNFVPNHYPNYTPSDTIAPSSVSPVPTNGVREAPVSSSSPISMGGGALSKPNKSQTNAPRGSYPSSDTWQLVGQHTFIDSDHRNDWQLVHESDDNEMVDLAADGTDASGPGRQGENRSDEATTGQIEPDDGSVDAIARQRRRGPFTDPIFREETSQTRKLKACVRCRIQRVRCFPDPDDPAGICMTCKNVSRPVVHNLPCLRYKVTEMILTRLRILPRFEHRWAAYKMTDVADWADLGTKRIKVKMNYCSKPFEIDVRRFKPVPGDITEKSWMDGNSKKALKVAPYAIISMEAASKDLKRYIDSTVYEWLSLSLFDCDELVQETFKMAERHAKVALIPEEKILMNNLFRLWYVVRQTAIMEHIVGDETLGMTADNKDRPLRLNGKIPLPPIMSHQLDMMLSIKLVRPLKKGVLDNLQRIIIANRPKSWFTIYLCIFILLHTASVLTRHRYDYARTKGLKQRLSLPEFVQELHHGANVLLAHYHYWNSGCHPFSINWKERHNTPLAELTPEQVQFMIRTTHMIKERESLMHDIKEEDVYEHELYFISQLYDKTWVPKDTVVV